jgi:hypothetical protein
MARTVAPFATQADDIARWDDEGGAPIEGRHAGKLTDQKRRAQARDAATEYAPYPDGSSFLYGMIAVVLAAIAVWAIGQFYDIDVVLHPMFVFLSLAVAFASGVVLRKRREQQHIAAYEVEREKRSAPFTYVI